MTAGICECVTCSKSKDNNNFLTTENKKESVDFQTEFKGKLGDLESELGRSRKKNKT